MITDFTYRHNSTLEYDLDIYYRVGETLDVVIERVEVESMRRITGLGASCKIHIGNSEIAMVEEMLFYRLKYNDDVLDKCWQDWENEQDVKRDKLTEDKIDERRL